MRPSSAHTRHALPSETAVAFREKRPAPDRIRDAPGADSQPKAEPAPATGWWTRLAAVRPRYDKILHSDPTTTQPRRECTVAERLALELLRRAWSIPLWPRGFVRCGEARPPAPAPPLDALLQSHGWPDLDILRSRRCSA